MWGRELGAWRELKSFSRANAAATHAGQGYGARVTRARATSMEDRCTGSAPSRLAHGTAARGMLGADGADFAARRERAARQSSSRHANDPTTHATSPRLHVGGPVVSEMDIASTVEIDINFSNGVV